MKLPKKEILEWAKIIISAILIAFLLNTCIIANSFIPSGSMERTIMTGDRVMGLRLSYRFGNLPERGDVVIFDHKAEPGKSKTRLIKRVVGLPGERVDIKENHIYINGSDIPLEEPYLAEEMITKDCSFFIPDGNYLMLGDNRNHSIDARFWSDPYVPEDEIIARALCRYYPEIEVIY